MTRWMVGAMCLLAGVSLSLAAHAAEPYEALSVIRVEAKPAPDFSLLSVDGRKVSLSNYSGKVVLLGFFQTF